MQNLTVEVVASGIVGAILAFGLIKRIWDGIAEARAALRAQSNNPIINAAAAVWDVKEREKFLTLLERLVLAQEAQANSLKDITDQQEQDMREKINMLVARLEEAERRPSSPPHRKTKSSS